MAFPKVDARPGAVRANFTGQGVSPGVACGRVNLGLPGLDEVASRALRDEEIEHELDRLESAGRAARVSLIRQRDALANRFTEEEQRIFDTHVKLLSDPVLEADVRERIVKKRMNLEGAVKETLGVYERLFEVVQSEALRNKLSDLRDVALRLLRCSRHTSAPAPGPTAEGGILVVHELSLSDLTEALDHGIAGIVAEAGNPASHAAILTRAAGLPAVIGAGELGTRISPGDQLLVDGESGQITLNPSPEMIRASTAGKPERREAPLAPPDLVGGQRIHLLAAVASPS
ncbi:MAG: phosphoenolpyruvate-utilizing N-terminal domain-containing protein, partial [Planctomycetota bacterium]